MAVKNNKKDQEGRSIGEKLRRMFFNKKQKSLKKEAEKDGKAPAEKAVEILRKRKRP